MAYVPDNYDQWKRHDAEQSRSLAELPECYHCGEPIQDERYVEINDECYCFDCIKNYYTKRVENYI